MQILVPGKYLHAMKLLLHLGNSPAFCHLYLLWSGFLRIYDYYGVLPLEISSTHLNTGIGAFFKIMMIVW
jgi:hypothetical protein